MCLQKYYNISLMIFSSLIHPESGVGAQVSPTQLTCVIFYLPPTWKQSFPLSQIKKSNHKCDWTYLVGVAGFEPATSASQTRRDNRATLHPEKRLLEFFFPKSRPHSYLQQQFAKTMQIYSFLF